MVNDPFANVATQNDPNAQNIPVQNQGQSTNPVNNDPFANVATPANSPTSSENPEQLQQEIQSNWDAMRMDYPGKAQDVANQQAQQPVTPQKQGPALPDPSTIMYDGIKDPKDAQALYDTYKNSPEATTNPITGEVYYHNKVVPYPELNFRGQPSVSATQDVFYGFPRNAGKELLKLGGVGADYIAQGLGYGNPQLGKAVEDNIPSYPSEGIKHDIVTQAPGIVLGGLGADALAAKTVAAAPEITASVVNAWPRVASLVSKIAHMAVPAAGSVAAMNENTEPTVVGDNAMWPLLKGVPIDKNGDFDQNFVAKKMNLFLDAVSASKALEMAGRAGAWTGNLIWAMTGRPIANLLRAPNKEDVIWKNIANELANYTPTSTKEQTLAIWRSILDTVNNNKDYVVKVITEGPSLQEVTKVRDTMSAIERGAQSPQVLSIARELRAGQKDSSQLAAKTAEFPEHYGNFTDQMHKQFGGEVGINQAKEGIQTEGINRVTAVQVKPILTQQAIDDAERNIATLVKGDPTLGPALNKLGQAVGINVNDLRNQTEDQIISTLRSSYEDMRKRASDFYKAIPEGTKVDTTSLNKVVKASGINKLDPATAKLITAAKGDFSSLYQNVVPRLSATISGLYKAGKVPEAEALGAIRDNITETQMDYLINHGSEDVANAATAARDYFKNEFAPIWRDGALEKFADLHADTVARQGMKPVQFKQGALDIVNSSLNDNKREYAGHIIDALDKAGKPDLAVSYQLGQVASNLENKLASGGKISDLDIGDFLGPLQKMGSVLSQKYPEQAQRINDFLNNFRSAKGNVATLKDQLTQYQKEADDIERSVLGGELSDFFKKEGVNYKGLNDGFSIFNKMIGDPEKSPDLINIIKNNQNDPNVMTGLKAAYGRYFKDHGFNVNENTAGGRELNSTFFRALSDPENPVWKTGEVVFQDNPQFLEELKNLAQEAGAITASRGSTTASLKPASQFDTEARGSINLLTTWIWGVLSHPGAKIRQLATRGIIKLDKSKEAELIIDKMFANPDEFTRVGERVYSALKNKVPREAKQAVWSYMVKTGLYEKQNRDGKSSFNDFSKIWDSLNTDHQMNNVFQPTDGSANQENPLDITVTPKDKK